MGMGNLFGSVINLIFCKFTLILIFLLLVIMGIRASRQQKEKTAEEPEQSEAEAERMRNYVATFSDDPWNSKEDPAGQPEAAAAKPKGKLESFYDGKTSAWGNTRKIIYKEKKTMLERAELAEQKDKDNK